MLQILHQAVSKTMALLPQQLHAHWTLRRELDYLHPLKVYQQILQQIERLYPGVFLSIQQQERTLQGTL